MGYIIAKQYWKIMLKYICPTILVLLITLVMINVKPLTYNDYVFPPFSEYIGWSLSISSISMIPIVAAYQFFQVAMGKKSLKVQITLNPSTLITDNFFPLRPSYDPASTFEIKKS